MKSAETDASVLPDRTSILAFQRIGKDTSLP